MNLFKKCTAKTYYFLVIDATLASFKFQKESLRKNIKTSYKNC